MIKDNQQVDCVITSPPYWGLRDYGIPPSIWDGDPDCEHDWVYSIKKGISGGTTAESSKNLFARKGTDNYSIVPDSKYAFCSKCGAWLGSLGLEPDLNLYIKHLCDIYDMIWKILKPTGTNWVNIGDAYSQGGRSGSKEYFKKGHKQFGKNDPEGKYQAPKKVDGFPPKCLLMIPERFAIEMINRGWILRNVIIWNKPNAMPESARDRFTRDFEYVYFFVKNKRYWFEQQLVPYTEPLNRWGGNNYSPHTLKHSKYIETQNVGSASIIRENHNIRPNSKGKNKRTTWRIPLKGNPEAHFATFPPNLVIPMIKAGCPEFICTECGKPKAKNKKPEIKKESVIKPSLSDLSHKSKYRSIEEETKNRAGMNRERGSKLIEKRNLPSPDIIISYLKDWKGNYSYSQIDELLGEKGDTASHWFTNPESEHGFSYPSKEDWLKLKEILGFDDKLDKQMTEVFYETDAIGKNSTIKSDSDCGHGNKWKSGIVLDPFAGIGTTLYEAWKLGRNYIGFEISEEYCKIAEKLLSKTKYKRLDEY